MTAKNNWHFPRAGTIIYAMKSFRNNPIVLAGMAALLLLLLVGTFLLIRLAAAGAREDAPIGTGEPLNTPGPTLLDLHATYDRTEAMQIRVYDHRADRIITMDLEEYVVGVVAAEMPVRYDFEALKAQAVASRTYTLYGVLHGGCQTNPDADVCTNSKCCQAFSTHDRMQQTWGDDYVKNYNRIAQAVIETAGEVVTYDGKIADALYHACSGGRTEDSENVYANALPYLRGVDSPYEDPMRTEDVEIGFDALIALIAEKYPDSGVTEDNAAETIGIAETYESGRVKTLRLGKTEITGKQARSLFDLRSTMFTITLTEDGIVFHVKGYGHGVGLSQNGANGMAKHGASYRDILLHYYTGVTIGTVRADGTVSFPAETPEAAPFVPEG